MAKPNNYYDEEDTSNPELDPSLHTENREFCYDPTCPCHEDGYLIENLADRIDRGEMTTDEADRAYRGWGW